MKKILMVGIAAVAAMAMTEIKAMSLADASGQIDAAIKNPALMTSLVRQLDPTDQVSFLSKVNAAIDSMPGSPDDKAAKYLDANEAAMKGAAKNNLDDLLAETYATVPLEALTVINERFAADLFNRAADPSRTFTDDQFTKIATDTMSTIQKRNAGNDNAGVRDTFAVLMFLRASNGTPANLRDTLISNLPDAQTRDYAKNDWIPPAMGEGQSKTYDPMLGAGGAGEQPNLPVVLRQAAAQSTVALLADLSDGGFGVPFTSTSLGSAMNGIPAISEDYGLDRVPRTMNADAPWFSGGKRGRQSAGGESGGGHVEPRPYSFQGTY